MFGNPFARQVLDLVRSENPEARLSRAAFTFDAWNLWCMSFPKKPDEPAVLLGFSDSDELRASTVRKAAHWAETTACSAFRIYVPRHTLVSDEVQALLAEEAGQIVRIDLPEMASA